MTNDTIDQRRRELILLREITSASNLLSYGTKVLRDVKFIDSAQEAVMTTLSIGLEKLYKLSLGMLELDQMGQWPSKKTMKHYGHDLTELHKRLISAIDDGISDKHSHLSKLVDSVKGDPVLPELLKSLTIYGKCGRFYRLDLLAGSQQPEDPDDMWIIAEEATRQDPEIRRLFRATMESAGEDDPYDAYFTAYRGRLAESIDRVKDTIATCARRGILGDTAKIVVNGPDPSHPRVADPGSSSSSRMTN